MSIQQKMHFDPDFSAYMQAEIFRWRMQSRLSGKCLMNNVAYVNPYLIWMKRLCAFLLLVRCQRRGRSAHRGDR